MGQVMQLSQDEYLLNIEILEENNMEIITKEELNQIIIVHCNQNIVQL